MGEGLGVLVAFGKQDASQRNTGVGHYLSSCWAEGEELRCLDRFHRAP